MLKNKDLNVIFESFLRAVRQQRQAAIPVIAILMTPEGKIIQFSGQPNRASASAVEATQYLERGVSTLVREGKCRAIGLPFEMATGHEPKETQQLIASIVLEHQDGSAYRVQLRRLNDGSPRMTSGNWVTVPTEPKFFVAPRFRTASF